MLRILMFLCFGIVAVYSTYADIDDNFSIKDEDLDWARNVSISSKEIFSKEVKKEIDKPYFDPKLKDQVIKPRPALQIFVSSSMPTSLLKEYAREAKKYGGALVLAGLPNGSVREFTSLVFEISDEDTAPLQIDDEAFRSFAITKVPAIVLAKSAPIFDGKSASKNFDKIIGAAKIKYALEKFASSGEMSKEAREMLQ